MPWKLIRFIIIFAVLLIFILLNYDNKSDISFGFFRIREAPVFLTVFVSFFAGLLCIFPYILRQKKKKSETPSGKSDNDADKNYGDRNKFHDSINEKEDSSGSGLYGID